MFKQLPSLVLIALLFASPAVSGTFDRPYQEGYGETVRVFLVRERVTRENEREIEVGINLTFPTDVGFG